MAYSLKIITIIIVINFFFYLIDYKLNKIGKNISSLLCIKIEKMKKSLHSVKVVWSLSVPYNEGTAVKHIV